jgi:hypothetical protein
LPFFHVFHIFSHFNLLFFHIFHIISQFNLLFFRIFHIFSLFNLAFFHIFQIFSLFNLPFFHIVDTDTVTSRLFRKSFNCRYNPRMDYAFCLLTLKSSEKRRSPLFGATCNFNDQNLPYGILFLTFISTNVFYLLSFKFSR